MQGKTDEGAEQLKRDALALQGTPFRYHGEPVLVPGSMGASSFVLVGQGNAGAMAAIKIEKKK